NDLRVLIISSSISKAFSAGIDVQLVKSYSNREASLFFKRISEVLKKILNLPMLTIAAINGNAYGAGADIALSCDLRVANQKTTFRFPGAQFGIVLGTHRLANEIGYSKARMLVLTNKKLSAQQTVDFGLVHELSNAEDSYQRALEIAEGITPIPIFTVNSICDICSEYNELSSISVAEHSALNGDFHTRFRQYLIES